MEPNNRIYLIRRGCQRGTHKLPTSYPPMRFERKYTHTHTHTHTQAPRARAARSLTHAQAPRYLLTRSVVHMHDEGVVCLNRDAALHCPAANAAAAAGCRRRHTLSCPGWPTRKAAVAAEPHRAALPPPARQAGRQGRTPAPPAMTCSAAPGNFSVEDPCLCFFEAPSRCHCGGDFTPRGIWVCGLGPRYLRDRALALQ